MALRDRLLAMAGIHLLGDDFQRVAGLLPDARQAEVTAALGAMRDLDRDQAGDRLLRVRKRQEQRMNRAVRKRFGANWDRTDPQIAQTVFLHGRKQNH